MKKIILLDIMIAILFQIGSISVWAVDDNSKFIFSIDKPTIISSITHQPNATVPLGTPVVLTWSSHMGATGDKCLLIEKYTNSSCPVFGPCLIPPPASIATKLPISGSITKNVINTTKYSMVCLFPEVDGSIQKSIVVNIDPNPISPVVTTFAASPASIMPGQSSTLTWASTNADKCSIDGVDKLANGSMSVSPTSTTTYKILCSKGTVDSPSKSVAITINTTVPSELSEIAKTKLNTWITKNITVRSTTLTSSNYVNFIEMVITKLNVIKANTPSSNKSKINTINYIVLELGKILSSIDDNSFLDDLLK